jgi:hypothetical protein
MDHLKQAHFGVTKLLIPETLLGVAAQRSTRRQIVLR